MSAEFELPRAGERYVFVANPETDNVAVIDAERLSIETVEAGDEPTFLQTLNGTDQAIVLNVASDDATIIRSDTSGSRTRTIDVLPGANAIAVAPDGRTAIAYFDSALRRGSSSGSFQDVTVIYLDPSGDEAVGLSVGFRPLRVFFSADSKRAFVVTEDGVSILDFEAVREGGGGIAETIGLGETQADEILDVSVTPDGRYALARAANESVLRLVDLDDGTLRRLDLAHVAAAAGGDAEGDADAGSPDAGGAETEGGDSGASDARPEAAAPPDTGSPGISPEPRPVAVTDVDLAPSGEYALAVLRDQGALAKIPIPGAFDDASAATVQRIENEVVGSVEFAPDGRRALLFTTAFDENERLVVYDVETGATRSIQLRKSIRSVAVGADGRKALVIHKRLEGPPVDSASDPERFVDQSFGYSLVDLETGFPKLQLAPTELGPFAMAPDGTALFVLFAASEGNFVDRVDLETFIVETLSLGSPPLSVGAVPGSRQMFVGQEHPEGRISFIDWVTGDLQSVTGFELNSRIRE